MKKFLLAATTILTLSACGPKEPVESSRTPKGNPNAAVVVTEYADLQCPACRAAHQQIIGPVLEKYGNSIRYEFHHFPLQSIHRFARDAGEASECAADQGKFWEFIDHAFANQQDLSFDALSQWGEDLGLDTATYEKCWKSHSKRDIVMADYEEGRELGVNSTPSIFVNGQKLQSNGFDTLSELIDEKLEEVTQRL